MPSYLRSRDPNFMREFTALVAARREASSCVAEDVVAIINRVRSEGDSAVAELTEQFDGHRCVGQIAMTEARAAYQALDSELCVALTLAAERITAYHKRSKPCDDRWRDTSGTLLGYRWNAVAAAGIYVPGGRAVYPSSVLMNAIPAKIAGVERLVMVTPTPQGDINPIVLAAAYLAGVDEIWRIGGAQAIAALAYGTQTIAPVDVITGPGNSYVAEAKRQLYGVVGIDMIAGPSEILVVADMPQADISQAKGEQNAGDPIFGAQDADAQDWQFWPAWIAADLLSQAEHDPTSQSILMCADTALAKAVEQAVQHQIPQLATAAVAQASWDAHGVILLLDDLDEAPALIDRLAAEHVVLALADPEAMFARIRHAGSVFMGRYTPEAIGDYLAGPNHVLPTGRRARFSSGLSVSDFMKRTSYISMPRQTIERLAPAAMRLAEVEGLPAHAASLRWRLAGQGDAIKMALKIDNVAIEKSVAP